jgi:hypothetical protein
MPNTPARCAGCKRHPAECVCDDGVPYKDKCAICGKPKPAHYGPDDSVRTACYERRGKHEKQDS